MIPSLALWAALHLRARAPEEIRRGPFFAALAFSALGDALFLVRGLALWAILAFGAAHLGYVVAFLRVAHVRTRPRVPSALVLLALLTYAWLVRGAIQEKVPPDLAPVFDGYALMILATSASALVRVNARGDRASGTILAGAVLFLVSDSLIALGAAGWRPRFGPLAIMTTYIAGQGLIAAGVVATRAEAE